MCCLGGRKALWTAALALVQYWLTALSGQSRPDTVRGDPVLDLVSDDVCVAASAETAEILLVNQGGDVLQANEELVCGACICLSNSVDSLR